MPEIFELIDLAQVGATAILLVQNWQLWQRLNEVNDRFITYLEERDAQGDYAAGKALNQNH